MRNLTYWLIGVAILLGFGVGYGLLILLLDTL